MTRDHPKKEHDSINSMMINQSIKELTIITTKVRLSVHKN